MREKTDFLMIHTGTKNLTNGVNKMRKLAKCVRGLDKDNNVNISFSIVISRFDRNLGQ